LLVFHASWLPSACTPMTSPSSPPFSRSRFERLLPSHRVLRAAVLVVFFSAAVLLLLAWGVPELLRWQITSRGSELLGRQVTVGKIRFVPWRLKTSIADLSVAAPAGPPNPATVSSGSAPAGDAAQVPAPSPAAAAADVAPTFHLDLLRFRLAPASLWKLAPVVADLELKAPHLRVKRLADGHYDIDDIIARLTRTDPSKPVPKVQAPPRFSVRGARIDNGTIDFNDQGVMREVRDLQLELPFIGTLNDAELGQPVQPKLAFTLDGSKFNSTADATPFAEVRKGEFTLRFKGLDLARWRGYVPVSLPVRLAAGTLDADITLDWSEGSSPQAAPKPAESADSAVPDPAKSAPNVAGPAIANNAAKPPIPATAQVHPGAPTPLDLRGTLTAHGLRVTDAQGADLASATTVALQIAHFDVLGRRAEVATLALTDPVFHIDRATDGKFRGFGGDAKSPTKSALQSGAVQPTQPAAGDTWHVRLGTLAIRGGAAEITDAAVAGKVRFGMNALTVDAGPVAYPLNTAVPFQVTADLSAKPGQNGASGQDADTATASVNPSHKNAAPQNPGASGSAHIKVKGEALPASGHVDITLAGLPLIWAHPYLAERLKPELSGMLDATATASWAAGGWKAQLGTAQIDKLRLAEGATSLASMQRLAVKDVGIDSSTHRADIGTVSLMSPELTVARDAQGHWMFESWLGQSQKTGSEPVAVTAAAPQWKFALGKLIVADGAFGFNDENLANPVKLQTSAVDVSLSDLSWPISAGKPTSRLDVALKLGADKDAKGRLSYRGTLGLDPMQLDGAVHLTRLPVPVFEPYFADLLNVQVARADLGFDGNVQVTLAQAGPTVSLKGALTVDDGRLDSAAPEAPASAPNPASVNAKASAMAVIPKTGKSHRGVLTAGSARAGTLFSWRTLALKDLEVNVAAGKPTRASVAATTLADFFVRIAVDPSGRINLQDLVRADAADTAKNVADSAGTETARAKKDNEKSGQAAAPVSASAKPSALSGSTTELQFGPTTFTNGRVEFTDNFVKPSYSASLTELNGSLGAFGNSGNAAGAAGDREKVSLAPLELHGKAEGSASLDITGSLNPLAKPLALDIAAKVRNLELPPLSPYSVKYAGHGIERGKLDMSVHYKIEPDGHLTATNSLVLRQLVFGEAVDGVKSLPVKLATALLANSDGVIDLDIPISGSINDPQFSLAPIIGKAIMNIFVRAITSPFSLISSALHGATQASDGSTIIAFDNGSAQLDAADKATLEKVAAAMKEHPRIDMTITGHASLAAEAAGYRRARLDRLVAFTKRREELASGNSPASAGARGSGVVLPKVGPQEYPKFLTELYDRTDMTKPRNALGLARNIPVAEMEQLLLAQIDVTPQAIHELAVQRAGVVRDALTRAGVPESRLFLGRAEVRKSSSEASAREPALGATRSAKSGAALAPGRVELKLATH
jgi:flagellar motor protein MotB